MLLLGIFLSSLRRVREFVSVVVSVTYLTVFLVKVHGPTLDFDVKGWIVRLLFSITFVYPKFLSRLTSIAFDFPKPPTRIGLLHPLQGRGR